jgi:hypothetical protein
MANSATLLFVVLIKTALSRWVEHQRQPTMRLSPQALSFRWQ